MTIIADLLCSASFIRMRFVFLCAFSIAHPAEKSTTIAQKAKPYIVRFAQKYEMQDCNPAFHPAKSVCSQVTKFLQNGRISAPDGRNFAVLPHSHCKRLKYCRRASCIFTSFRCKNAPPGRKIRAGRRGCRIKFVKTGRNYDVIRQYRIHRHRRLQSSGADRRVRIRPGR